jgi:hypothetical protein
VQAVIKQGLFAVDVWLSDSHLAIMCLPRDRFSTNAIATRNSRTGAYGTPAPQPLGQARMLHSLLSATGVPVVMVPHHIWTRLENDSVKRAFLERHLASARAVTAAAKAASTATAGPDAGAAGGAAGA